ncbi:hypothetical protein C7446_1379 [Kushneria sinocarnis]|uniref:Secretin/TonB short N-terminal domain-containing protein n=1 Tax=Kushneria sinocarnis TaxID=595502 RepID=A0A420WWR8_9GAMM|nr:STN domain-containing protein [Kushneria sinocarnis]RKR04179.1 hypothetical protein C7446_1379 [Kushneria sinocarnis]
MTAHTRPCAILLIAALMTGGCSATTSHAPAAPQGACDRVADYAIPAQRFDETAQQLAHATGCFIRTDLSRTGAIPVQPVTGTMSLRQALERALQGTGLSITDHRPDTLTVY